MIDLAELARLELAAKNAWQVVHTPALAGEGESVNAVTNREMNFTKAVRAEQAVAAWWMKNSDAIKPLLRPDRDADLARAIVKRVLDHANPWYVASTAHQQERIENEATAQVLLLLQPPCEK